MDEDVDGLDWGRGGGQPVPVGRGLMALGFGSFWPSFALPVSETCGKSLLGNQLKRLASDDISLNDLGAGGSEGRSSCYLWFDEWLLDRSA